MQNFKKNTETLKISHPPPAESLLITLPFFPVVSVMEKLKREELLLV